MHDIICFGKLEVLVSCARLTLYPEAVTQLTQQLMVMCSEQVLRRQIKSYVPSFAGAFEHVCIHTGGRGVIDEIERQLQLPAERMEASRATLFRYGNVSSSSIWYATFLLPPVKGVYDKV